MDHPFFDALDYPLYREEAVKLLQALSRAQQDTGRVNLYYQQCGSGLPLLTLPAAADKVWAEALHYLTVSRRLQTFCTLAKTWFSGNQDIQNLIRKIENAKPAAEKRIFSSDIFILNREAQRQAISQIIPDGTASKVLLVKGGPKSGKSYCLYILRSIAEEKNAEIVYLYDGIVSTLHEAISNIFSALGASADKIPPEGATTDEAWYKMVCVKLKELATANGKKIWIVADDLGYTADGGPILDTRIRMFFEQFALFLVDPSFAKYFRLLLIHYAEPSPPTKWKMQMWKETETKETDIQAAHVEDFLKDWADAHEVLLFEDRAKELAAEVIAGADNPAPQIAQYSRLQRIHILLSAKLDGVRQNQ